MDDIKVEIGRRLARIEADEGVKILYACESGSRAWGFASTNSDWDVRFIYVRPLNWYLSVDAEKRRDVIELPIVDDLDINGWDIRKALWLLRKSNPPLLEWLYSPIVYKEHESFLRRWRGVTPAYYSLRACYHHYYSMARQNYRGYLQGDTVRLKKYLYALRPLLAVIWMEQGRGRVPVEFEKLLECCPDDDLRCEIDLLVKRKSAGEEMDEGGRVEALNRFIEEGLARLKSLDQPAPDSLELEPLNQIFRESLEQAW